MSLLRQVPRGLAKQSRIPKRRGQAAGSVANTAGSAGNTAGSAVKGAGDAGNTVEAAVERAGDAAHTAGDATKKAAVPRTSCPWLSASFGVYNFVDKKAVQCTILSRNRTLGPFFVEEIVHIETLMREIMTTGPVARPPHAGGHVPPSHGSLSDGQGSRHGCQELHFGSLVVGTCFFA